MVTTLIWSAWETVCSRAVESLFDTAVQYYQAADEFKDEWKSIQDELEIVHALSRVVNEVIGPQTTGEGVEEVGKLEALHKTALQSMEDAFQATQSYSSFFLWPSQLQKIKKTQEDVRAFIGLASPLIIAVLQKAHHNAVMDRLTILDDALNQLKQQLLVKDSSVSSPTGKKVLNWLRDSFPKSPYVSDDLMLVRIRITVVNNSDSTLNFLCSKYGGIGSDEWFPLAPAQRDTWMRSEGEHMLIAIKESREYVYFQARSRHVLVDYSPREGFQLYSSCGVSPAHRLLRLDTGVQTPSSSGSWEICNYSKRAIGVFISKFTDTNASDIFSTVAPGLTAAQARPLDGCEVAVISDLHRQAYAAHYGVPTRIEWHGFTTRSIGVSIINNSDSETNFFCSNYGGEGSDATANWRPLAPGERGEWTRMEGEYLLIVAKGVSHHFIYIQVHNSPVVVGYSPRDQFNIISSSGVVTPASLLDPSPPGHPSQWEVRNFSSHSICVFISKHTNSHGSDESFTIVPGSTEVWERPSDGHEVIVLRDPHRELCAAHYGTPARFEWCGFTMRQVGISIINKSQFRHCFCVSAFAGFGSDDWFPLDSGKGDDWMRSEGEYVLIVVKESRQFIYFQVQGIHVDVSYSPAQGFIFAPSPYVTPVRRPSASPPTRPSQWEVCNSSSRGICVFVSKYTNPSGSDQPLTISPGSTQTWDRPFDGHELVVIRDPLRKLRAAHYGPPARIEWSGFARL
ncbi:hypothetical protein CBR_g32554 [Chara braunii]|uniref:Uncharacterized protein n=1 Tax=Chara braunii TaxID=69332 RepID=A0A388LH55_CHABU|nr:hypothetical protein CBR_g32554 [Chara braunii]|eukprot:GBG81563.1 hypothetical protein CBR_g32554 [Chara braunii]